MSDRAVVLASRVAWKGRIFEAVVERIRVPGRERETDAELVRHAGSVGIAAMPRTDSVLLVRQYRHATGGSLWELPAGSVDEGEDAETAARRECQEELGLVAEHVERLGEAWPLPGYCTELMTFYRLTGLREPGPGDPSAHQDEDEDIETAEFTLADLRRMVRNGDIRDMKAAALLALL
jgi:ADP-ribose pyrophosphatase